VPLGEARGSAIEYAKGEYLTFLDCDDLWSEDKLEQQVKLAALKKNNFGFIYSRCDVISHDGLVIGKIPDAYPALKTGDVFAELLKTNFIPFVSVFISTEKYHQVGGFPLNYKNSTDFDLFLKLSYQYEVYAVDSVLCQYREHDNNLSKSQQLISAHETIASVANFLPDERAKIGLKYQYLRLVIAHIKEKQLYAAFCVLLKNGGWSLLMNRVFKKIGTL